VLWCGEHNITVDESTELDADMNQFHFTTQGGIAKRIPPIFRVGWRITLH
jgi:hypothetical protein